MKFTKDLGPTAKKVARRMLQQRQGLTHQLDPLFQSPPDSLQHPRSTDHLNSVINTITNQGNQPPIRFGDSYNTDATANYKGKMILVDDGKRNRTKWDVGDNLEFLFSKQKGGVKIADNKDFSNKNLDYSQVGNRRTVGSFWSNNNGHLNQNVNKMSGIEDISGQKEVSWNAHDNGKPSSSVYPWTYLSRSRNLSSVYLGFDGEASPLSWVPQPPMHSPTPVQPQQNWCLPLPATTTNSVVNDNFWNEQEFQLALAINMKMKDQESNVRSQNLRASSQANHLLQAHPHGPGRQQPQDRLLTSMPQRFWSQMVMSGANYPEQHLLPFGTQQDNGFQMGNLLLHPPPGI